MPLAKDNNFKEKFIENYRSKNAGIKRIDFQLIYSNITDLHPADSHFIYLNILILKPSDSD